MNIKLKYYLRGLGAGIILATIILAIAFRINKSPLDGKQEASTKKPIYSATENNSEAASKDISQNETEAVTESVPESETEAVTEATTETVTETVIEQVTDILTGSDAENIPEEFTDDNDSVFSDITVIIPSELNNSYAIAEFLSNNGIVSDASDFNYFLERNGYDKTLQTGEKTFPAKASYDEIAQILCK